MNETGQMIAIVVGILNIFTIIGVGVKFFGKIVERLSRIEYALYNDGKTGLVQEQQEQSKKIDSVIQNQQAMKIDLEVLKVKAAI